MECPNIRRVAAVTAFCLMPLASAMANDSESMSQLPVLPVSAVHAAEVAAIAKAPVASSIAEAPAFETKQDLVVIPGVNEIIPIAVIHTNRVVLPFDAPRIRTTSNAGFEVEGRSIYVTSNQEGKPVTAFVSDADNPDVALSLTFVPKRMPPVQVNLTMSPDSFTAGFRSSKKAQSWEESQPYINTLRELLREVAVGNTPQGYSLNEKPNTRQEYNGCRQAGLEFSFHNGQVLEGHNMRVNVGVVENRSNRLIELREPSCAGEGVRAVSVWPNPLLQPGEKSEVYVVRSIEDPASASHNARRSLLQE